MLCTVHLLSAVEISGTGTGTSNQASFEYQVCYLGCSQSAWCCCCLGGLQASHDMLVVFNGADGVFLSTNTDKLCWPGFQGFKINNAQTESIMEGGNVMPLSVSVSVSV